MAGVAGAAALDEFDPKRLGPYTLLGRLGAGGMGTVYLGHREDGSTAEPLVAIKVIHAELANDPAFRRRFEMEARTAQRVHHTYTAAVLDVDIAGSRPYLVTEHIEGPTLAARVRDSGPLTASNLLWLGGAIAQALYAIHTAGVIHRDLKPANIILSLFGTARVIDFGIARALDATTMATQGSIGTPAFMAPEQILDQEITATADVHAWGAVMLFAATGETPFSGATTHIIMRQVLETTPDVTTLPDALRPLAARALAKDPADRPTAAELVDALSSHAPPATRPTPTRPTPAHPAHTAVTRFSGGTTTAAPSRRPLLRRHGWRVTVLVIAIAAVAAAAVAIVIALTRDQSRAITSASPLGQPLTGPANWVRSVPFSPDGKILAIGSSDGRIRLWDVKDPSSPKALGKPLTDSADQVLSVAFSPDGKILAAGSADRMIRMWDIADPRSPRLLGQPLTGAVGWVWSLAFSPDGNTIAGTDDRTVHLWDVHDPSSAKLRSQPLAGPTNTVTSVTFAKDGKTVAAGSDDKSVYLWNVEDSAKPRIVGPPLVGPTDGVWSVAFSPNGRTLAAGGKDKKVYLWSVKDPARAKALGRPLSGAASAVWSVAFSPDGRTLAAGSEDKSVYLWDTGKPTDPRSVIPPLTGPKQGNWSVSFSPDGRTLAAGSKDGTTRLWALR